MKLNPADFSHRKAYLIGFKNSADRLAPVDDLDTHLSHAKQGLLQWGFTQDEIHCFSDGDELPEFDSLEEVKITSQAEHEDRSLIFMFFKGHAICGQDQHYLGCLQAINEVGDNINLEGFLAKIAQTNNVYTVGLFDCCRRLKGRSSLAFNPALQSCKNIALCYRDEE